MSPLYECAEPGCEDTLPGRVASRCGGNVVEAGISACGRYYCAKHLVGIERPHFCRVCSAKHATVFRMKKIQEKAGIYGLSKEERQKKLAAMPPEESEKLFHDMMAASQDWQKQTDRRSRGRRRTT